MVKNLWSFFVVVVLFVFVVVFVCFILFFSYKYICKISMCKIKEPREANKVVNRTQSKKFGNPES